MRQTPVVVFDISDSVCEAAREVFGRRQIPHAVYQLRRDGGLGQDLFIQRELIEHSPRLIITEWVSIGVTVIHKARAVCELRPGFWLYTILDVTAVELESALCTVDRIFHKPHSLSDIADEASEFLDNIESQPARR